MKIKIIKNIVTNNIRTTDDEEKFNLIMYFIFQK